jgi:4'-phosphopantetheinyl transferase
MPLLTTGKKDNNTAWIIWQLEESDDFFLKSIPKNIPGLVETMNYHPRRKSEWLCSRYLLYNHFNLSATENLQTDEFGRKYLDGKTKKYYSISHSSPMVAVLESEFSAGIDVEAWRPEIEKPAVRFLHPDEMAYCSGNSILTHAFWSAKEAMFKASALKGLNFRNELRVYPDHGNSLQTGIGHAIKNNVCHIFHLNFYQFNDGMMVISMPKHE